MSFGASLIHAVYRLSGVKKLYSLPEDELLKAIEKATDDCIARQQLLFNRAKLEVAAFKSEILNKFKEQTSIISQLPDAVPLSPEEIEKWEKEHIALLNEIAPAEFDIKHYGAIVQLKRK